MWALVWLLAGCGVAPGPVPVAAPEPVEPLLSAYEGLPVPGAQFVMGQHLGEGDNSGEANRHKVTLTQEFWVGVAEVTREQWTEVMGDWAFDCHGQVIEGEDLPATCLTWFEAIRFANALSMREQRTPAYTVDGNAVTWDREANGWRLPTEAEFEHAARRGADGAAGDLDIRALIDSPPPDGSGEVQLFPVRSAPASKSGLYGLNGNASEWCWDWYGPYPEQALTDPIGPQTGAVRVTRGGAGAFPTPMGASVASRGQWTPEDAWPVLGVRLVRNADPEAPSSAI